MTASRTPQTPFLTLATTRKSPELRVKTVISPQNTAGSSSIDRSPPHVLSSPHSSPILKAIRSSSTSSSLILYSASFLCILCLGVSVRVSCRVTVCDSHSAAHLLCVFVCLCCLGHVFLCALLPLLTPPRASVLCVFYSFLDAV